VVRVLKKDLISGCRDERGGGGPSPGYPHVESNANLAAFHPRIPPGRCPNQICQTFSAKAAIANSCSSFSHKAQTARTSQTSAKANAHPARCKETHHGPSHSI